MNLFDYFCKNVVLQDCDGTVWHGYVDTFIPAIDSEDEVDEISLITNKGYICFHESEIRSIRFDRKKETKK